MKAAGVGSVVHYIAPGCTNLLFSPGSGTFRLTLKADDEMKPLFGGTLNGKKDNEGNVINDLVVTLPDWFRPEKIAAMFESPTKGQF